MHIRSHLPTTALTIIIALALATASGCAAMQADARSSAPSAEVSAEHYIQAVNQRAVRRGYQVTWINPPRDG